MGKVFEVYLDGYNQALNDIEDSYIKCMQIKNGTIGCPGCDDSDSCIIPLVEMLRNKDDYTKE